MKRSASAQWRGTLKQGEGHISTDSGALRDLAYSFTKRFGDEIGTNPEELIAAAHSACYAMALTAELEQKKITLNFVDVKATVSLENVNGGWSIPAVHLDVTAGAIGVDEEAVKAAAQSAKANCPVSKVLKADITLDFHFSNEAAAELQ